MCDKCDESWAQYNIKKRPIVDEHTANIMSLWHKTTGKTPYAEFLDKSGPLLDKYWAQEKVLYEEHVDIVKTLHNF